MWGGEVKPSPYDYGSVCDDGLSTPYVQGTNYEDCLAAENEQIDAIREDKGPRLERTKRCYTVSGYLSAALLGSVLGLGAAPLLKTEQSSERLLSGVGKSVCLGFVALIPTTICGFMHSHIEGRLEDSREKAKECCEVFPTQEELAEFAAASADQTLAKAPASLATNTTR